MEKLKERESETSAYRSWNQSSNPLISSFNLKPSLTNHTMLRCWWWCADDGDGVNCHALCGENTRLRWRWLSCSWENMVVDGAMVVCGWSMVVGGLNGWHWVFGDESQVVSEISSRSLRTATSIAPSIQLLFFFF